MTRHRPCRSIRPAETLPVLLPSQLASELGPDFKRNRIRALLAVAGWSHALRLAWPKVGYPAVRPALLDAAWVSGGAAQSAAARGEPERPTADPWAESAAPGATAKDEAGGGEPADADADAWAERAALAMWDAVMADGKPAPKAGE